MEACIRQEFGLSMHDYRCLMHTLRTRFGIEHAADVAFLSPQQLAGVTDRFEAAATRRLFDIATAHIGVEKLYRESYGTRINETSRPGIVTQHGYPQHAQEAPPPAVRPEAEGAAAPDRPADEEAWRAESV